MSITSQSWEHHYIGSSCSSALSGSKSQKPPHSSIHLTAPTPFPTPRMISCPCTSRSSRPRIRRVRRSGSALSASSSDGRRSSRGSAAACACVRSRRACVLVSAREAAWERGVDADAEGEGGAGAVAEEEGEGEKCARRRAEKRSPTPEKYPGRRGTVWA